MKPSSDSFLVHGAIAAAAALCVAASAAVPSLEPAPGARASLVVAAHGVQIYECRAADAQGTRYAWTFVAPQADLFDAQGVRIGTHGAGPHWQADDGSRLVGAVKARLDSPQPGAIPWLLLVARASGPEGIFSRVSHIQRVHTVGGLAPASGCDREHAGRTAAVAYRADYRFFIGGEPGAPAPAARLEPPGRQPNAAAREVWRHQGVG
jgi:hypothetical protein